MNREATPIWYRINTICFYIPRGEEEDVQSLRRMRSLVTENIRHISLLTRRARRDHPFELEDETWHAILSCTRLETLELHACTIKFLGAEKINQLLTLPNFRSLHEVTLHHDWSWWRWPQCLIRLSTEVELPIKDDKALTELLKQADDFYQLCIEATRWNQPPDYVYMNKKSRRMEPVPTIRLDLGDGRIQRLRLYGQPNTWRKTFLIQREEEMVEVERQAKIMKKKIEQIKITKHHIKKKSQKTEQLDSQNRELCRRKTRIEELRKLEKLEIQEQKAKKVQEMQQQRALRLRERRKTGRIF